MIVETDASGRIVGKHTSITPNWDRSVDEYVWAADMQPSFSRRREARQADLGNQRGERGAVAVSRRAATRSLSIAATATGWRSKTAATHQLAAGLHIGTVGARRFAEVLRRPRGAPWLAELNLPRRRASKSPSKAASKMQMWILKPPGFESAKKWPVAVSVHGGPQGAWEDVGASAGVPNCGRPKGTWSRCEPARLTASGRNRR